MPLPHLLHTCKPQHPPPFFSTPTGAVNVSVLVDGSHLYSHELGVTGDFFVLPRADLFSLTNELCRDARIVAYVRPPAAVLPSCCRAAGCRLPAGYCACELL